MSELALKLIAENKKTKNPFLDLGSCGLVNYLPDELFDCVWLEDLSFNSAYSSNSTSVVKVNSFSGRELLRLQELPKLKKVDLSVCKIRSLHFFENFNLLLEELNLSMNDISDLTGFKYFKFRYSLKKLDLYSNKIIDLNSLSYLENLETLGLAENSITDAKPLGNITKLKYLNLNYNYISDISFLINLSELRELSLKNNRIIMSDSFKNLQKLITLSLDANEIKSIRFLEGLNQLQNLNLSKNSLSDIAELLNLEKLKSIDLSSNKISTLTWRGNINLKILPQLQYIDFSDNLVQNLKYFIDLLKQNFQLIFEDITPNEFTRSIKVYNNLILSPPPEVLDQGEKAIIEYFEGRRKPLNECKLIFVGDGGVGKTSLMRRVVFNTFDIKETTTHGINKIAWEEIRTSNNEKIRVNLWDFGGQHIQHSLHQFFFTKRVVYVLVLNPRNDLKANYWLDQIEKLGCDSEILIVYNWQQTEDKQADFMGNFYELRKKYPKLPEPFVLSCATGEGIEAFKKRLIDSILQSESLKDEYLIKWFNIKQRLEEEVSVRENYINYDTYQTWCSEEEYHDADRQKDLLKILNRIGSIVFFDKPKLEDWQVLNPEWITTGAYSILVSEQNKTTKGHLSWQDLKAIFKEEKEVFSDKAVKIKYTENQFQFIIDLMLEYDLCQINPFKQHEYLIPSAFGEKPNKNYDFAKDKARIYRLQFESPFEMLVIHRFIAKNLSKIIDKDYWQSGIYIKHPSSETYALVETNLYSKRIDCWIKGENIRGFWEIIRADFKEILNIYHNFKYREEVEYVRDGKSHFLSYQEMLNTLADGIRVIEYDKETRLRNIDVLAVLDLFEDVNQTYTKMDNERGITINTGGGDFINNGQFGGKNNTQINNAKAEIFGEIKELLLDLEEYNIQNEVWKAVLIKALDEFHKLEDIDEKSSQKTSISILDRTFKKLKELKDVVSIGFLTVDIEKKLPTLLAQWDTLKTYFH